MTKINVIKRTACIFFAFLMFVSGVCIANVTPDSFDVSSFMSENATIQAVSRVSGNDTVISKTKYDFSFESILAAKPKHIQSKIVLGIKEYLVTAFSVIVLFSLLKTFVDLFCNLSIKAFHVIILFIHNKDGSKPIFA